MQPSSYPSKTPTPVYPVYNNPDKASSIKIANAPRRIRSAAVSIGPTLSLTFEDDAGIISFFFNIPLFKSLRYHPQKFVSRLS